MTYVPNVFKPRDRESVLRIIEQHPFATVVSARDGEPLISHAPALFYAGEPHGSLRFHLARANPHARGMGERATLVFHGPDAYVSPLWYRTRPQVPTWNYVVVHAAGTIRRLERDELLSSLEDLTRAFEAGETRWSLSGVPQPFVEQLLPAIEGFELRLDRLEGKLKLSQNREPQDRLQVIERLSSSATPRDREVAAWMKSLPDS